MGSKCFNGFNVSLPVSFGVGSPNQKDTNPWASSCKIIAISAAGTIYK